MAKQVPKPYWMGLTTWKSFPTMVIKTWHINIWEVPVICILTRYCNFVGRDHFNVTLCASWEESSVWEQFLKFKENAAFYKFLSVFFNLKREDKRKLDVFLNMDCLYIRRSFVANFPLIKYFVAPSALTKLSEWFFWVGI